MKTKTNFAKRAMLLMIMTLLANLSYAVDVYRGNADFKVNNVYYHIDSDNTVSVDYEGSCYTNVSHACYAGDVVIPETVEYNGKTYTVVGVKNNVFYFCKITSVTLPNTIKTIGDMAFMGSSIEELTLPSSLRSIGENAFVNSKIKSCRLPEGIEEVPKYLFSNCQSLTSVTLPSTIKKIGVGAFQYTALKSFIMPDGIVEIPASLFNYCGQLTDVQLPSTIKKIGADAFRGTALANILLLDGLEEIGNCAFRESQLTGVTLPKTIKTIGEQTFYNCAQLGSVGFLSPSNLKVIGAEAFRGCPIYNITIPENVESIEWGAFISCSQLKLLTFKSPSKLKYIGGSAFKENRIYQVTIPASVDSIAEYAFSNSQNLGTVKFEEGSNLRIIGKGAFDNTPITEIQIPEGVERIGEGAFLSCTKLKSITFPEGLKEIPKNVCYGCSNLKQVVIPSTVKYVGESAFYFGDSKPTIDLKASLDSVAAYAFSRPEIIKIYDYDAWINLILNYKPYNVYMYTAPHIYLNGELLTHYVLPEGITTITENTFEYNKDIRSVVFPQSLQSIGKSAFSSCSNLETIVFGNSIKHIWDGAFSYCDNIKSVDIGNLENWCNVGFYGRADGNSLRSNPLIGAEKLLINGQEVSNLTIPSTVTEVGHHHFSGVLGLTSVTIPNSVKAIGEYAFTGCTNLNTLTIGKGVETLGEYAFAECTNLKTLNLGSGVETLGKAAFSGCRIETTNISDYDSWMHLIVDATNINDAYGSAEPNTTFSWRWFPNVILNGTPLTNYVLPDTLTTVKYRLFYENKQLTSITFPNSIKTIEDNAFYNCTSLQEVTFGEGLESIAKNAFENCNNLSATYITNYDKWMQLVMNNTSFNWSFFPNWIFNGQQVSDYVIPEGITSIPAYAFDGNKSIQSVVFPNSLKEIRSCAFRNCSNLKTVTFGDSIQFIASDYTYGSAAFQNCVIERANFSNYDDLMRLIVNTAFPWRSLPNVYYKGELITDYVIPEGTTSLRVGAFNGNKSIKSVTFPNSLKTIERSAFYNCSTLESVTFGDSIENLGDQAFYNCTPVASITNVESWTKLVLNSNYFNWKWFPHVYYNGEILTDYVIPEGITEIRNYAFQGNQDIQSVTFPNSLKSVNYYAFQNCNKLKTITFGDSIESIYYGFQNCVIERTNITNYDGWIKLVLNADNKSFNSGWFPHIYYKGALLTDYVFPEGITSIRSGAFNNNTDILSITFPNSLKTIEGDAFYGCTGVRTVTFGDSVENIGESFYRCSIERTNISNYDGWIKLVLNAKIFNWNCFQHIYYKGEPVTNYVIPEGYSSLRNGAFEKNRDIQSITFPNSLNSIGKDAFFQCSNLKSIVFGNSIKTIGENAFGECNPTSVDIGDITNWCNVRFEGNLNYDRNNNTFYITSNPLSIMNEPTPLIVGGQELNSLTIPSGVTRIGDYTFMKLKRLEKVNIPNSVTEIGALAFFACPDLQTIKYGKNPKLSTIGNYAFSQSAVSDATFPSTVTSIGEGIYAGCQGLESITIPANIEEIPIYAFAECYNIANIQLSEGVKIIGSYAFRNTKIKRIEIPTTLNTIYAGAFNNCYSCDEIHLKDLAAWCNVNILGGYPSVEFSYKKMSYYLNGELMKGELIIPEGTTSISQYAFYNAGDFTSFVIPEGVKSIGIGAFFGPNHLASISLPSTIEYIGFNAFSCDAGMRLSGHYYDENQYISLHLKDLSSFVKANQNTGIDYRKLYQNYNNTINLYVNGKKVENLVIPEGITSMANGTICGFNISSVTFPSTLEYLYEYSLTDCANLRNIFCRGKFAPSGTSGLKGGSVCFEHYYVPKGRANNYKARWSEVAALILEAPEDILMTGDQNLANITDTLQAHSFVYGRSVSCVDLSAATLAEDVTAEGLKEADADGNVIFFLPDGSEGFESENMVVNGHATKIVLKDGADFAAPYDFTADEVVYERSFPADGNKAYPLCLPYTLPTMPEGLTAYSLTGQDNKGRLEFTETAQVVANQPYLVMASEDVTNLNAQNVQFLATPEDLPDAGIEGFEFRGTMKMMTGEDASFDWNAFVLQDDMTWAPVDANDERAIKPMTAFISPDDDADILHITIGGKVIGRPFGDLDGDGLLSNKDVVALINIVLGKQSAPEAVGGKNPADINGDNQISIADVTTLVNIILGK